MYVYKKHFTIEEARALIPELQEKLERIRRLADELKEAGFDIYKGRYRVGFHPDTYQDYPPGYNRLLKLLSKINSKGIEIKGVEQGLVDFPAVRPNGEEVFLCWKIDEYDIEFWHTLNGGYRGRQHIDEF